MYAQLLCGCRIVVVYTAFIVKVRRIQIAVSIKVSAWLICSYKSCNCHSSGPQWSWRAASINYKTIHMWKITGRGKVLNGGKKPWCPNLEKMREGVEVTGRWWGRFSLQMDCLVTHRGCPPPLSSQVNNRTKQWTKTARRGWVSESRYSKSITIYQCHNRHFMLAKHTENTQCTHINYDRRQTGKGIEIDLLWL